MNDDVLGAKKELLEQGPDLTDLRRISRKWRFFGEMDVANDPFRHFENLLACNLQVVGGMSEKQTI